MLPPLLRINYYQEGRPTASFKEAHTPKDVKISTANVARSLLTCYSPAKILIAIYLLAESD